MASQWVDGDVPALAELAVLREALLNGKISVASEVRLRTNEFGLSPAGRQSRRWMITEQDQERAGYKKPGTVTKLRVAVERPASLHLHPIIREPATLTGFAR